MGDPQRGREVDEGKEEDNGGGSTTKSLASKSAPLSLSTEDLAFSGITNKATCCVLVTTKPNKGDSTGCAEKLKADYKQVVADIKELKGSLY